MARQAEVPPPARCAEEGSRAERVERDERDTWLAELLSATAQGDCRAFEAFFDAPAAMER